MDKVQKYFKGITIYIMAKMIRNTLMGKTFLAFGIFNIMISRGNRKYLRFGKAYV